MASTCLSAPQTSAASVEPQHGPTHHSQWSVHVPLTRAGPKRPGRGLDWSSR